MMHYFSNNLISIPSSSLVSFSTILSINSLLLGLFTPSNALWPIPSYFETGNSTVWLDTGTEFTYEAKFFVADGAPPVLSNAKRVSATVGSMPTMNWAKSVVRRRSSPNLTIPFDNTPFQTILKPLSALNSSPSSIVTNEIVQPRDASLSSLRQNIIPEAVERVKATIFKEAYIPWRFHPRGTKFEPDLKKNPNRVIIKRVNLVQLNPDPPDLLRTTAGQVDESYELEIDDTGSAEITAKSSYGLLHGLTTFTQLFYKHSCGDVTGVYTSVAPVHVRDAPAFAHRGLNLDVSRAFYPVEDLKRTIDGLALSKFNRFHLHATDSQSWPLEIPSLPDLAIKSAFNPRMIYSPSDIHELQEYAALRGIQLIVEVDMPGHCAAIGFAYPELITAIKDDFRSFHRKPLPDALRLNDPNVHVFLDKLFEDLLPRLNGYTQYFHMGGDEVSRFSYLKDPTVNSSNLKVLQPLMQRFVNRIHDTIRKHNMIPIVWEEMLLSWNLTLGNDVIIQIWRSPEAVLRAVSSGHKVLVGSYDQWYLDCGMGQFMDFSDARSSRAYPYADYCSPRKNWRLIHRYNPFTKIPGNLRHLIIGGEAHLWSELVDPANLDRQLWPRTAVVGEVLWSGPEKRSHSTSSKRLADLRERLIQLGISSEPIYPPSCNMEGGCTRG